MSLPNGNQEVYKAAMKKIYELVKDVPALTDLQLNEKLKNLDGEKFVESDREWKVEAVVRLIQHRFYKDNDISVPKVVQNNFDDFFTKPVEKKKIRKTPKNKKSIDRLSLNKERNQMLLDVTNICAKIIDGETKFHPESKYGTIKVGKSVVMFIERKLRKIIVFMGGERGRRNNPKLEISIGVDKNTIRSSLEQFIQKNLESFTGCRDKRWKKCEFVLEEVIKSLKNNLKDYKQVHAHPSGRYTTFKNGRLVLVFVTQDRAKGEVAFHPGGERESNPEYTTAIKVKNVKSATDIDNVVKKFIDTHYKKYTKNRDAEKNKKIEDMKHVLNMAAKTVKCDGIFQHPKNFFGLVKNEGKPLLMVKVSKTERFYDVLAWVKKQKNNPKITIGLDDEESINIQKISELVNSYLNISA